MINKEILKYIILKNLLNSRIIAEVDAKLEIFLLKNHKIRLFLVTMVRVKESEMKIFIIFIFIGLICRVNICTLNCDFFPHFQLDVLYFK